MGSGRLSVEELAEKGSAIKVTLLAELLLKGRKKEFIRSKSTPQDTTIECHLRCGRTLGGIFRCIALSFFFSLRTE